MPRTLIFLLCCVGLFQQGRAASVEEPEEGPPIFFTRDLAPGIPLKSETYTVSSMVEVHGFTYTFKIDSIYGSYEARGVDQLKTVLHELKAIEELAKLSQSEAFASSLSNSLTDPLATTFGVARRPVASVTGLPSGIVRYLGGKLYQVRRSSGKAYDSYRSYREKDRDEEVEAEPKEKKPIGASAGKLSRKHLGYDSAKRKWAREMGVDPYSKNEALQEALGRIAWSSTLGGFAGDFAVPSSQVFSYAGKAREIVWDRPAYQIEREIVKMLKDCGLSKDLVNAFRDAPFYSLTEKMELCLGFEHLQNSGDLPFLVDFALGVESEEDAELLIRTVAILVLYTEKAGAIDCIGERRGLIYACSKSGYEIYPMAVDYLHWTPLVYEAFFSDELKSDKREIWVSGKVSPIAKMQLREYGWLVFDQVKP